MINSKTKIKVTIAEQCVFARRKVETPTVSEAGCQWVTAVKRSDLAFCDIHKCPNHRQGGDVAARAINHCPPTRFSLAYGDAKNLARHSKVAQMDLTRQTDHLRFRQLLVLTVTPHD